MADSPNVHITSDANFQTDVLQCKNLALVDFWAEWCGPCKMIAPTLALVADELAGKLSIYKMNVDENSATATKFSIRSIPTLLLFKNGEMVDQLVGNQPKDAITATIKKHL